MNFFGKDFKDDSASKYLFKILKAKPNDVAQLDAILEEAITDDNISVKQYRVILEHASKKGWFNTPLLD